MCTPWLHVRSQEKADFSETRRGQTRARGSAGGARRRWHDTAQDGTSRHESAPVGTRRHKMAQVGTSRHQSAQDGTRRTPGDTARRGNPRKRAGAHETARHKSEQSFARSKRPLGAQGPGRGKRHETAQDPEGHTRRHKSARVGTSRHEPARAAAWP